MKKISFHYADKHLNIKQKNIIKNTIEYIFSNEKKELEKLDYIFCSDDYLLEINKTYLNHDYYTDIITFDLSNKKGKTEGEIYISLDRIKDNATQLSQPLLNESLRVIFHGALHLCGYGDKKEKEIIIMRQKEDFYIFYHLNSINKSST